MTVYLDNSSTTMPCNSSISEMNRCLKEVWGNPSSLHSMGIAAENVLNDTRDAVALFLGCNPDEIYFTSGGTESNNLAIFGAVQALSRRGNRIVTTSVEHPSVLECFDLLEKKGFEVVRISPDSNGAISEQSIRQAINSDTILVSIMLVNNETGHIFPVDIAKKAIESAGAPAVLHCDAVQAFGKMPVKVKNLGCDLLSFSGHKIHAPKGVGVLYKSKGCRIIPQILGGHQEKGLRSGTENVPAVAGLLGALKEIDILTCTDKVVKIHNYAKNRLLEIPNIVLNSGENSLPYILNFSMNTHRSETMLHFLEERNVFVSSGSACAKGQGSYVLKAMGMDGRRIDSAIRLSFSGNTTTEEIDLLVDALKTGIKTLRASH
ncbi:MAG: cysteine desulfurase family protein [Oscillospiraceae bacterium]